MNICDINCDLGEGGDEASLVQDARLMAFISRCNIACGGHAGTDETMQTSLINAKKAGIKVGAHPSYPDKANFGRRSLWPDIQVQDLLHSLRGQITRLTELAAEQHMRLSHIKLHGALYNDAEKHVFLAEAIVECFCRHFPTLEVLGLADGAMRQVCQQRSVSFLKEGFMDRAYLSNGQLVPRAVSGAVYEHSNTIVHQALQLARGLPVQSYDGVALHLQVDSICLHGDQPNALMTAQAVSEAFREHNINVK